MELHPQGARILGTEALLEQRRPDAPRGTELGYLLEYAQRDVKEESEAWRNSST
ncbi:MAG: hypothetical protein M1298_00850 [Chloroflexi bacterium]|nr:hypothetical protein [Chloroflexota bacterium]